MNIGDDPINNKIFGLDFSYSNEAPWLTRMVDAIPLISTKEKSSIAVTAEGAYLKPGHARAINEDSDEDKGGVVYIDDFEGSISALPLHTQPNQWVLASVPQNDEKNNNPLFPESNEENTVLSGVNRAQLNWYRIDDAVRDNNETNPYVRRIELREVFRNLNNVQLDPTGILSTAQTLDLTYYPNLRGSYNFDVPGGTAYSAGLGPDGTLNNPGSRWAGVMRDLNTNDFQAANVEFVEFWLLSPFLDPDGSGNGRVDALDHEGELYINLGNISEDILRDSRKFFENGLPSDAVDNGQDPEDQVVQTQWGRVPIVPQITTSFDSDPERRADQDVGLDGLDNAAEIQFHSEYLNAVQAGVSGPILNEILTDPSNDDYTYYNDNNVYTNTDGTLVRYRKYNNTEGNTPSTAAGQESVSFGRTLPDTEDLNDDLTLNETESYFQYRVPIKYDGDRGIELNDFVIESVTSEDGSRVWYRFKIPLDLPAENPNFKRVGGIQDFRSIRFIRMYLKDFKAETTLRFARLDLVRNQWRRFRLPSGNTGIEGPVEESDAVFDVNDINIEENGQRQPYGYILPPGITRERPLG